MSGKSKTVLFMHQMKISGVALNDIIFEQYGNTRIFEIPGGTFGESAGHFSRLPESEKQVYKLVIRHIFFGLHRLIPVQAVYITMLHRPVERVVSLYHYQLRPRHKFHISPRVSLEEYLNPGTAVNTDNGMTRFIAGTGPPIV